jgi:D-glycero-D-manno-heptose 1,7-bisphosphate phosphatase
VKSILDYYLFVVTVYRRKTAGLQILSNLLPNKRRFRICLFLDADGVLWPENGTGEVLRGVSITQDARNFVSKFLKTFGYQSRVIVITNQTSAARNEVTVEQLVSKLRMSIVTQLKEVTAIYSCFHHPHADNYQLRMDCSCRKPHSGLFFDAQHDYKLHIPSSVMVGDRITDMQAAAGAGVKHLFIIANDKMFMLNETSTTPNETPSSILFFVVNVLDEVVTKMQDVLN